MAMEISKLFEAYQAGRVRHFKPYLVRNNEVYITLQELCRNADDTGDVWKEGALMSNGQLIWYASEKVALDALASVGLMDAYKQRFTLRDDGVTILNW